MAFEVVVLCRSEQPVPESEVMGLHLAAKSHAHMLLEAGVVQATGGRAPDGRYLVQYRFAAPTAAQPEKSRIVVPNLAVGERFRP